jgi:hypothetical protein
VLCGLLLTACDDEPPAVQCGNDSDCPTGRICADLVCVPVDSPDDGVMDMTRDMQPDMRQDMQPDMPLACGPETCRGSCVNDACVVLRGGVVWTSGSATVGAVTLRGRGTFSSTAEVQRANITLEGRVR